MNGKIASQGVVDGSTLDAATEQSSCGYSDTFQAVLAAERARILEQRVRRGVSADEPSVGLAASGGGLRATAFALGVAEGLARQGCFRLLDYISSVGGGSLAAGALQRLAAEGRVDAASSPLLRRAVRRHLAQTLPSLVSGSVVRRDESNRAEPFGTFSSAMLALFQGLRSVFVYGGLLIGFFALVAVGDSVVTLLKPALRLVSTARAWYYVVKHINLGLAAASIALLAGSLLVLWGPVARYLRRGYRAVAPAVPAVGSETWRGLSWFLATALFLVLAMTAFFGIEHGWPSRLALIVFGGLALGCRRAWRSKWSQVQTGSTRGIWAYVGVCLSVAAALASGALIWGGILFYVLGSGGGERGQPVQLSPNLGLVVAVVPFAWLAYSVVYLARRRRPRTPVERSSAPAAAYARALAFEGKLGSTLAWVKVTLLLGLVQLTHKAMIDGGLSQFARIGGLLAFVVPGTVAIAVRAVGEGLGPGPQDHNRRSGIAYGRLDQIGWRALCALVVFAMALLANAAMWGILDSSVPRMILVLVVTAVVVGSMSPLSFTGLTRLFRHRLIESVLPDERTVADEAWRPALRGSELLLADWSEGAGPYLLINASLTTTGSRNLRVRNRTADGFVLSPLYVGSGATGWAPTQAALPGFTVADALATSALNLVPGGRSGEVANGWGLLAAVLAVLSLRTGTWLPNPNPELRSRHLRPNLLIPGITRDVLGRGLQESAPMVCLSDGRYFDQLGLYEMLRRELDVILVADASNDPHLQYAALAQCLNRAREDLGIDVTFPSEPVVDTQLDPGQPPRSRRPGEPATLVASIHYPGRERTGTLIVMKPVLCASLPLLVESYAAEHPRFPHEAQVIGEMDEQHFYAYEQLGVQVALEAQDAILEARQGARQPPARHSMVVGKDPQAHSAAG